MKRAMPALLLVVALLAAGCSQRQEPNEPSVSDSGGAPKSVAEPISPAPTVAASEKPSASLPPSAAPVSPPSVAPPAEKTPEVVVERSSGPMGGLLSRSRNEETESSDLLHPQQVQRQSRRRSVNSARPSLGVTADERRQIGAMAEEEEIAPTQKEAFPSVALTECELYHNHREGATNEVTIFYGTDRDRVDRLPIYEKLWSGLCSSLSGSVLATFGLSVSAFFAARKKVLILGAMGSGLFSVFLGFPLAADLSLLRNSCAERKPGYGVGRGDLQLGVCRVAVPPVHSPGAVESPSIFRLDIIPDPERHFILSEIEPMEPDPFYEELRQQVSRSPKKDLFVFIHGYNVSFESAALRTAQMKVDLEFAGAACFYSWPSQGGLLQYTRDEENVRYTVSHLRQFLLTLTKQSGARSIHLIAHSMGNRAVTEVLKELRLELGKKRAKLFNEVILAAPDVDAQIFVKDIAPRIRETADRVTLYASSNDRALIASKIVHGYPRAGESGKGLVVVEGVETVDVSNIDCSLLGHSYYGDSKSVLTDLALVLRGQKPALERTWLTPEEMSGLTFWKFSAAQFETARRMAQQLR